uniref:Uncharacterized protein n=1 Tax=Biomphalaria glabrata TaxID=6526 RepID=A0A2C9LYJ4_BIOGL
MYKVEAISVTNWTLVFRAQSGINVSFYDLWETNGHHDDLSMSSDFPIGCYRLDNLGNCKRHFRSYVLDNWTNIDQIKISVYANGSETAYMIFNGSASNRQSWFSRTFLVSSYWTSLANDTQVFWFSFQGTIAHLNLQCHSQSGFTTPTQRQRAIVNYQAYNSDLIPAESQACVPNTGEEHHTDNSISRHTKRTQRDSSKAQQENNDTNIAHP